MTVPFAAFEEISSAALMLLAILFNLLFCSTTRVARLFSLPMSLASGLIATLERRYNRPHATEAMRLADSLSIAILLAVLGFLIGLGAEVLIKRAPYGWIPVAMIIGTLLGPRALLERTRLLIASTARSEDEARVTLTYLTGRDASRLDRSCIAAAGIESVAMSLTQSVIAPIALYLIAGLPALLPFKLLDTASIMIDERSDNARSFGSAPRNFAGLVLWPLSWLTALLIAMASFLLPRCRAWQALRSLFRRERYAWPTFSAPVRALAHGLGVALGGSVCIGRFERPGDRLNASGRPPETKDLAQSRYLAMLCLLMTLAVLIGLAAIGYVHPIRFI
ncbi:MAG: hypothetical protein Tsb008_05980 [Rhodothalassiaceae bacterium]